MKIAILNDTHFGARGDSQLFFDYFMKFFNDVFFPYMDKNNIKTVIHAGDLMDRRKFVNFSILNQVRKNFMDVIAEKNIDFHCILGNHDVYYRNTNEINSVKELFSHDINIYESPKVVNFDGLDIALLPWVNKENEEESLEFIRTAAAPILIGHLELDGYEVLRGVKFKPISGNGMSPSLFSRYEKVLSGHFHCRQERGNIYYMGTQYQITFADLYEPKGFHVFDTDTREIEFIENPHRMFYAIDYDDADAVPTELLQADYSEYKDAFVRVVIHNRKNPYSFDRFMEKLYESGVSKITTIEDNHDVSTDEEDLLDLAQDTVTLINNEIDAMEEVEDKGRMKKLIKDLYMESLSQ